MVNLMLNKWLNTIQCIDSIIALPQIPDNSVNLLLTDPPYGISRQLNCKGMKLGTTATLDFDFGKWDKFNYKWIELGVKKTKGWFMSFCAKKDIGIYWDYLEKNKFKAIDVVAWQKPDPIPLNAKSRFLNAWEAIIVGKKNGAFWGSNYKHNILKYQAPKSGKRFHPTQKPIELIRELIMLSTEPGDIVLDPFIGSGTTAVACKQLGRNFVGFEASDDYCKIANIRLLNETEYLEKQKTL